MSSSRQVRVAPATRASDALVRLVPLLSVLGGFMPAVALASADTPPPAPAAVVAPAPLDLAPLAAHTTALHLLADRLELAGDARAIAARQAAVESSPASIAERIALIETALHFRDNNTAQRAADDIDSLSPANPEIVFERAAIDYAGGFPSQAESRLSRNPSRLPTLALDVSILDLRYGKTSDADSARKRLTKLQASSPTEARVRFELVRDALHRQLPKEALQLARSAAPAGESSFAQALQVADLEQITHPDQPFATIRDRIGAQAHRPADAALFMAWLLAHDDASVASAWFDALPAEMRAHPDLVAAQAHLLVARRQWDQAYPLIEAGAWGARVSSEVRHDDWPHAIHAAGGNLDSLRVLYRLALTRDSSTARKAVLNAIIATHHEQSWAYQSLADLHRRQDDTAALAALYTQWHEADPDNLAVESNRLLLDVLVSRKATTQLRSTIDKLLMFHPDQPLLGLARALALWQVGRKQEAFEATGNIPAVARNRARLALYHGLFAAANGQRGDYVQSYLNLAQKSHLLPEEHNLLRLAEASLAKSAP